MVYRSSVPEGYAHLLFIAALSKLVWLSGFCHGVHMLLLLLLLLVVPLLWLVLPVHLLLLCCCACSNDMRQHNSLITSDT